MRSSEDSRVSSRSSGGDGDEMEEMELDAARVLAGFAQAARMERRGEAGGSSRGEAAGSSRGEAAGSSRGEPAVSGRGDEGGGGDGSGGERGRKRRTSRGGAITPASSQGTRISLSADEKEAKRMRRILANRESARQTIRRRQAVRDELTKKVADLSMDNKKMKMEKELVMKEYMSLKDKNKQLKEQIANTIRSKVEGGARVASQRLEVSESLSTELPLVVHSRPPFIPYIWPSFPSNSPNSSPSYQEGLYPKTCGLKKLFHVPPYSWFYPLIHQLSGYCPPYPHVCSDRDEATRHKEREPSSCSQAMNDMDKTSLCRGSKSEVSVPIPVAAEKEINVIRTSARPSSFQRENQMPGSYPDGVLLAPSPLKILNPRSGDEGEHVTDAGVRSHKHHLDSVMPDKPYEEYIHPREKVVETSAAAEARKRRKELTKLKRQLQRRQVRLPR